MVLVRGNDAWTGVRIAEQAAWATQQDNAATWYTVPLIGEGFVLNREFTQPPREFGALGYREFVEYGRSFVQGTITVLGRYDAKWFNLLLAHATWSETVVQDKWLDGTSSTTDGNTHVYSFSGVNPGTSAMPYGLNVRVYKGGPGPSGSVTFESYVGCIITGFTIEQPENEAARFTFTFVGKTVTHNPYAVTNFPAVSGVVPVRVRDNANSGAYLKTSTLVGGTPTQLNFRSYRITVDRHIEFDPAFINTPDSIEQPGLSDIRDVTADLTGYVEQDFYSRTNATPYKDFLNAVASKLDLMLVSATALPGTAQSKKYGLRIEMPNVVWEKADLATKQGGPNDAAYSLRAVKGTMDSGLLAETSDMRLALAVGTTDEPSANTAFSSLHA